MTQYLIAVTATSGAVDYDYFRKLAEEKKFDLFMSRKPALHINMTFIPRTYTTALDHQDVIDRLESNSPLLVTYDVQVIVT